MSGHGFAGALRERVTVERWHEGTDDLAGDPGAWISVEDGWASIRPDHGRPDMDGAALSTRRRYRIVMRDLPEFGLRHRLMWKGLALTPLSVERDPRSEEHTSELQSLMRISYAVFCLK